MASSALPISQTALVRPPPVGWRASLRAIGPGLIVVGSIVGSGEVVTTTLLGAREGFTLLWLILLSCAVKIIIQEQWAYYVISSGGTILDALNRLPGPRLRGISWGGWLLYAYFVLCILPTAGVLGMAAAALFLLAGGASPQMASLIIAAITITFYAISNYGRIEKLFIGLVSFFSLCQFVALVLTQRTEYAITAGDLWSGLQFSLPSGGVFLALSTFGVTGVGTAEILFYPTFPF